MTEETGVKPSAETTDVEKQKDDPSKASKEEDDKKEDEPLLFLDKDALEEYRNNKTFCILRWAIFAVFTLIWLALVGGAVAIVLVSPKAIKEPWYKKAVVFNSNYGRLSSINAMRTVVDRFELVQADAMLFDVDFMKEEQLKALKAVPGADKINLFASISMLHDVVEHHESEYFANKEYRAKMIDLMVESVGLGYHGVAVDTGSASAEEINLLIKDARMRVQKNLHYIFDNEFTIIIINNNLLTNFTIETQLVYHHKAHCSMSEFLAGYDEGNSTAGTTMHATFCDSIQVYNVTAKEAYRMMLIHNYFTYDHSYIGTESDLWFQEAAKEDISIVKKLHNSLRSRPTARGADFVVREDAEGNSVLLVFNPNKGEINIDYQKLTTENLDVKKAKVLLPPGGAVHSKEKLAPFHYKILQFAK